MISERMKHLVPYTAGEQPQGGEFVKLNTNENPYPPAPTVAKAIEEYDVALLRRYPDPKATELCRAVADEYGILPENVFPGNGSDEVLSFAFYAFFDGKKGPLLFPEFTYSFYPVYCDFYGIPYRKVPLASDLSVDTRRFLAAGRACGVAFANPNAPTGSALKRAEIEKLLDVFPKERVVLVDEAYVDYGAESVLPLLDRYENLLVVNTFSKSRALAGMRLGFAFGNRKLIEPLFTVKDSFNSYPIDRLAQVVGVAATKGHDYYQEINRTIASTRDGFAEAAAKAGYRVLPSKANFVFASLAGHGGRDIYQFLRARNILVRYFELHGIQEFVRISIGTEEEMAKVLSELEAFARG